MFLRAAFKEVHAFATRIGKQPDLLWKESQSAGGTIRASNHLYASTIAPFPFDDLLFWPSLMEGAPASHC